MFKSEILSALRLYMFIQKIFAPLYLFVLARKRVSKSFSPGKEDFYNFVVSLHLIKFNQIVCLYIFLIKFTRNNIVLDAEMFWMSWLIRNSGAKIGALFFSGVGGRNKQM